MKNTNIKNLSKVIPIEIRLEIYKETLDFILKNDANSRYKSDKGTGLCLLLPVMLWGLSAYYKCSPDDAWSHQDVGKAFPEIKKWIKESKKYKYMECDPQRVEVLQQVIKKLSKS